jgi:hypothetical protein
MDCHPREPLPQVPREQQMADALLKQARKLRWIGFDFDAHRVEEPLQRSVPAGEHLTPPSPAD